MKELNSYVKFIVMQGYSHCLKAQQPLLNYPSIRFSFLSLSLFFPFYLKLLMAPMRRRQRQLLRRGYWGRSFKFLTTTESAKRPLEYIVLTLIIHFYITRRVDFRMVESTVKFTLVLAKCPISTSTIEYFYLFSLALSLSLSWSTPKNVFSP